MPGTIIARPYLYSKSMQRNASVLKNVLFFICLSLPIGAGAAPVTWEGNEYNLFVVDLPFVTIEELLKEQVWWGDSAAAIHFAREARLTVEHFFAWEVSEDFSFADEVVLSYLGYLDGVFPAVGPTDTANDYVFAQLIPSPIPLPAAAWLFGSALFGLGAIKRKSISRSRSSC